MEILLRAVRVSARFSAAALFWLHAFALFHVPTPTTLLGRCARALDLNTSETAVIFAIGVLTVLASYGAAKFTFDVAYIYFFPFILVYRVCQITFTLGKAVLRLWAHRPRPQPLTVSAATVEIKLNPTNLPVTVASRTWQNIAWAASRPFRQFTLLWCLLLLLTSGKILLWTALVIVVAHLVRSLGVIFRLVLFLTNYLTQVEQKIKDHVESLISKLAQLPDGQELTDEIRKLFSALVGIKIVVYLLRHKRQVNRWVLISSLFAYIVSMPTWRCSSALSTTGLLACKLFGMVGQKRL